MGSSPSAYKKADYMPEGRMSSAITHFYGKQKPNSKDGDDTGLAEIYECWDFPQSNDTTIHILPRWRDVVPFYQENWDARSMERTYPTQLQQYGVSEEAFKRIMGPINDILVTFYPFQDRQEIFGGKPYGENQTFYLVELRKRLKQVPF